MTRPILSIALFLALAGPTLAADLPDLAITSSQPGEVTALEVFDHSYTVTNLGSVPGRYQTTDSFTTYFDILAIPSNCYIDTTLVRGIRRQVGVVCNGILGPGESVTLTETLQAHGLPWSGNVVVNRNRNLERESSYANNAAWWAVR